MQTNTIHTRYNTNTIQYSICSISLLLNERLNVENETYIRIAEKGESAVKANGRRFDGRRRVAGSKECEASPGSRMVAGKSNGRRFKGMRRVAEKSNGRRFEGRRRVAGSKECEASSGSRMVAGSKECEGSPLSLIGDGWLLTELHRRQFELHRRRLSLIATVGLKLNCNGLALWFFFFFD